MAKKKLIKAIIFDLGGVIVHGGYLEFINQYCMTCLSPLGRKKILELERRVNLGDITEQQFYEAINNVFGVHLNPEQMHKLILKKAKKDEALLKIIAKLGKKRVALFSNSIGHMALDILRLQRIPAKKLFRRVFISTKLHLVKPDQVAYSLILKKLKIKPSEAIMVDDRMVNIQGARKAGMSTVLYQNAGQFQRAIKKYAFA